MRYVLEGSVQREQSRVRVNAQLIDADSGAHLWADRFEEEIADLFKLQDQVVARLANSLGWELMKAEAKRSARSKNPDGVDLVMRGLYLLTQDALSPTKDNTTAARALFDQALKLDPNDADALAGEVETYMLEYGYGWRTAGTDYDAKIIAQADRAIALDPGSMLAYWAKGLYLMNLNRPDEARRDAEAGLAVNPNFARFYVLRGLADNAIGRFEEAKSELQYAMRLSPRDPGIGYWLVDTEQCRTWPRELRRRDRRMPKGDRRRLSQFHSLRGSCRRACARRQDRKRRSPPWRKRAASTPSLPSNGCNRLPGVFPLSGSKACAKRGCRRSETHNSKWPSPRRVGPLSDRACFFHAGDGSAAAAAAAARRRNTVTAARLPFMAIASDASEVWPRVGRCVGSRPAVWRQPEDSAFDSIAWRGAQEGRESPLLSCKTSPVLRKKFPVPRNHVSPERPSGARLSRCPHCAGALAVPVRRRICHPFAIA